MREHSAMTTGIGFTDSIATPQSSAPASPFADFGLPVPTSMPKSSWDMAQLRLPQDYAAAAQETVQASVSVGKPGPQIFFRAHPEWQVHVATLAHDDCLYLVSAALHEALEGDYKVKLIVPFITRDGDVGLWPLSPLQAAGRTDTWTASAHRVLVASRQSWVRMRSNMRLRGYDLIKPKATWDEPVWPEQEFDDLLQTAFEDRVISSLDHPVVRALQGEA